MVGFGKAKKPKGKKKLTKVGKGKRRLRKG